MAYSYEHSPTNPDAIPLYNDNVLKFWEWFNDVWSCSEWITWHKANEKKYGREEANRKFIKYYSDLAFITSTVACRSRDTAFRDYTRRVGILDGISSPLSNTIGTANDVVSNVGSGITSTSKAVSVIMPLIIVAIAVMGIIFITKYAKKK